MAAPERSLDLRSTGALAIHGLAAGIAKLAGSDEIVHPQGGVPPFDAEQEIDIAFEDELPALPSEASPSIAGAGAKTVSYPPALRNRGSMSESADGHVGAAMDEQDETYTLDPSAPEGPPPRVDLGIEPGSWTKWGAFASG